MRSPSALVVAAAGAALLASCNRIDTLDPAPAPGTVRLERFASAQDFRTFLQQMAAPQTTAQYMDLAAPEEAEPPGIVASESDLANEPPPPTEITNNQTIGVDEGGIVKQVGRFLVVLKDGRLFSADLGNEAGAPLRLVDRVNVYRTAENEHAWYDEMLVSGNRILVTAYSYGEKASEISVFRIDSAGKIAREGRFLLSSDDYFSTDNYATRLVGDMLVLYAPIAVRDEFGLGHPFNAPRLRRADGAGETDQGAPTLSVTDIYKPAGRLDRPILHTLSMCPLREQVECRTTGFIGGPVQAMYVSPTDAFLWLEAPEELPWQVDEADETDGPDTTCRSRRDAESVRLRHGVDTGLVYRVPLDGNEIGAVAAHGLVADQFALDSRDGRFRALVARSDFCNRNERAPTPLALLDIPLAAFEGDVRPLGAEVYVPLPAAGEGQLRNRFLGGWLLYGMSADPYGGRPQPASNRLVAVPLATPQRPTMLTVPHDLVRIERAGRDAILTGSGSGSGLALSYLRLDGAGPVLASTALLRGLREGESRSHAFGATIGRDGSGLVGIATSRRSPEDAWTEDGSSSAMLSFLTVSAAKDMQPAGELELRRFRPANGYRCEVSCVEWYGNARPIFSRGRVFALMGTELVEGRLNGGRMAELGRLDLTGRPMAAR